MTTQPTDSQAEPSRYGPGLLRLITAARVTRDLLIVVIGIALIVVGLVARVPAGDFNYTWLIGLIMVICFGIAAFWHAAVRFDRRWPRLVRFLVSLAGIGLGSVLLAYSLGGSGVLGERAEATLTNCQPVSEYIVSHTRTHVFYGGTRSDRITTLGCDAVVRWPDGSRETLGVTGRPAGTMASFVKPGPVFGWAFDEGPAYPWSEAMAIAAVGGLMILQAVYSIVVVIVGGLVGVVRPRRADLPAGRHQPRRS